VTNNNTFLQIINKATENPNAVYRLIFLTLSTDIYKLILQYY